jgi:hypothetical protein
VARRPTVPGHGGRRMGPDTPEGMESRSGAVPRRPARSGRPPNAQI